MARKLTKKSTKLTEANPDWYSTPEGRRALRRDFRRAMKEGTLEYHPEGLNIPRTDPKVLAELVRVADEAIAQRTRPVSLRLPEIDIARAKRIAEQRGIGYQTVMKEVLSAGLRQKEN